MLQLLTPFRLARVTACIESNASVGDTESVLRVTTENIARISYVGSASLVVGEKDLICFHSKQVLRFVQA